MKVNFDDRIIIDDKVIIDGEEYIKKSDIERLIYCFNVKPDEEELFERVEQALGFKLFAWQKSFIVSGEFRRSGKTLAECLRILLAVDGEPLYFAYPPKNAKESIFRENLKDIEAKLKAAGIPIRRILWSYEEKKEYLKYRGRVLGSRWDDIWDV